MTATEAPAQLDIASHFIPKVEKIASPFSDPIVPIEDVMRGFYDAYHGMHSEIQTNPYNGAVFAGKYGASHDYMPLFVEVLSTKDGATNAAATLFTRRHEHGPVDTNWEPHSPENIGEAYGWTDADWIYLITEAIAHDITILYGRRRLEQIYGDRQSPAPKAVEEESSRDQHEAEALNSERLLQLRAAQIELEANILPLIARRRRHQEAKPTSQDVPED